MNVTTTDQRRYLFYAEQDYCFDILRPLQTEARAAGFDVRWMIVPPADPALLHADEIQVADARAAVDFRPDAVFAPADRVPGFIPGLKVQVFHGINEDKRGGTYPERGLFDLYCTQSPTLTNMLKPLEAERGYFRTVETGWLKLDAILNYRIAKHEDDDRPTILYASTFTPRLSGAEALRDEIARLSSTGEWRWRVTLHPKMAPETVAGYRALESDNLSFHGTGDVIELLHRAAVMVSDNSSILQEFLILQKPVVTYRNRAPLPCMIDIREAEELESAVRRALAPEPALTTAIAAYGPSVTPYSDGRSAARVLEAVEDMLNSGWQDKKPLNLWRNMKMRRQLGYYRLP